MGVNTQIHTQHTQPEIMHPLSLVSPYRPIMQRSARFTSVLNAPASMALCLSSPLVSYGPPSYRRFLESRIKSLSAVGVGWFPIVELFSSAAASS